MSEQAPGPWHDVAALDDLFDGAGLEFSVAGQVVAVFRDGDAVHATDPMCTHGLARLCEGFLEDGQVECPLHQGRFDLVSGAATCAPATRALQVHPVRLQDGRVWVALGTAAEG